MNISNINDLSNRVIVGNKLEVIGILAAERDTNNFPRVPYCSYVCNGSQISISQNLEKPSFRFKNHCHFCRKHVRKIHYE